VVVVGGGAAGLSIALRLHEQGADVVVLERHTIGRGVTGGSTAKVTALHGVLSSRIRQRHGDAVADAYVDANRTGLDDIRATIERHAIACELTDARAVDFAATPAGLDLLEDELVSARAGGLAVERGIDLDVPFAVLGAITLAGQAHLHPGRWCEGLAAAVGADRVHEHTAVLRIDEEDGGCTAVTAHGTVRAEHAVVATHAPIVDPRYLTTRCRPHRSYAIAVQLDGEVPADMYLGIDADEPVRSLRPARVDGTTYLIVGGEGHPVADEDDARDRLDALEAWAREHFPVRSVDRRWAAHDQMPSDDLPFIGRMTPGSHRWVATGFQKWGLTTSAVAAAVIGDGILGGRHPAAHVFDPSRLRSSFTGPLAADVGRVAARYVGDHVRIRRRSTGVATLVGDLEPGDGIVVPAGRGGMAVHRDADGVLHTVSAVCTHEGCLVRFNRAQTSWDCPCHGSRFTVDGEVITGPAVDDLPAMEF